MRTLFVVIMVMYECLCVRGGVLGVIVSGGSTDDNADAHVDS